MPKLVFTPDELKQYFTGTREYHYCKCARDMEKEMRVHSDGVYPVHLIDCRRPNEPLEVQTYRKQIFIAKTKPYFTKIESTLQKIRRSSDWSIKYKDETFDKIIEGEKLNDYAELNYPLFGSITNWAFSLLLRNYLIDANALVLVAPVDIPESENKFLKPVATIFNSCDVIDFVEGDYAVIRNKVGCVYMSEGRRMIGSSYYIITTQTVFRYDQLNGRKHHGIAFQHDHGLDELPVFKLGGIVIDVYGGHSLYESRICGILPEFNEALREYSDLQAAVVLSMFPEKWEYTNNECTKCKSTGQVPGTLDGVACQVTCQTCQGVGYIASGPYSKTIIKPGAENMGQQNLPTPPKGFVQGPVEIIKLQQDSVEKHIYNALAAINFEFLAEKPLATSGVKTAMDGDELNNTVHAVAEDMVAIMDKVYYFAARYRYSEQYNKDEIKAMLPMIAVPEKYDILSTKYYDEQMTSAIKNNLSAVIINNMEVAYASKAFNNDPEISEKVALVLKLDPLAGISEDNKMSRLSNNGITQLDYVVSSNINKFVNQALENDAGFTDLDTTKQKEIIYKMAEDQESEMADSVIKTSDQNINPGTGLPIAEPVVN